MYHLYHRKAEKLLTWTAESWYLISGKQSHTRQSPFPVGVGVHFSVFILYLNITVSSENLKCSLRRNETDKRDGEGHPSSFVTFIMLLAKYNLLVKSFYTVVRSANGRLLFLLFLLLFFFDTNPDEVPWIQYVHTDMMAFPFGFRLYTALPLFNPERENLFWRWGRLNAVLYMILD